VPRVKGAKEMRNRKRCRHLDLGGDRQKTMVVRVYRVFDRLSSAMVHWQGLVQRTGQLKTTEIKLCSG
jgi:hypothetical protein